MKTLATIGAILSVIVLGGIATVAMMQKDAIQKLDMIAAASTSQKEGSMDSMVTTYASAKGTVTVTTFRTAGETDAHLAARHLEQLTAMQAVLPKV